VSALQRFPTSNTPACMRRFNTVLVIAPRLSPPSTNLFLYPLNVTKIATPAAAARHAHQFPRVAGGPPAEARGRPEGRPRAGRRTTGLCRSGLLPGRDSYPPHRAASRVGCGRLPHAPAILGRCSRPHLPRPLNRCFMSQPLRATRSMKLRRPSAPPLPPYSPACHNGFEASTLNTGQRPPERILASIVPGSATVSALQPLAEQLRQTCHSSRLCPAQDAT